MNTRAQTTRQIIIGIVFAAAVAAGIYLAITHEKKVPPPAGENIVIVDSAGRKVTFPQPLENVVLLTSDAGEAARLLGAEKSVVGVTRWIPKSPGLFPVLSKERLQNLHWMLHLGDTGK